MQTSISYLVFFDFFLNCKAPQMVVNNEKVIMNVLLCRQVLIAWYAYKEERKRKARRIAHALEQRRLRLLRSGVQQILLVSADMTLLRQKMAAQQGAQVYQALIRGRPELSTLSKAYTEYCFLWHPPSHKNTLKMSIFNGPLTPSVLCVRLRNYGNNYSGQPVILPCSYLCT